MASRRQTLRYPRLGDRVAPVTLRNVLLEPIPSQYVLGTPATGLKFCDLDESIWQKLPHDSIAELSNIVVARVAAGCARKAFAERRIPPFPQRLTLVDLRLEHRTHLCLAREGFKEKLQALAARRRADRVPTRVLDGHGRTDDGKVWLSYRLSKAASTYAVITVPAALKQIVEGRFTLLTRDGQEVGTLAAKDGRAWGLGAFLRQQDAQSGDRVNITLDLDNRSAVIELSKATQGR